MEKAMETRKVTASPKNIPTVKVCVEAIGLESRTRRIRTRGANSYCTRRTFTRLPNLPLIEKKTRVPHGPYHLRIPSAFL